MELNFSVLIIRPIKKDRLGTKSTYYPKLQVKTPNYGKVHLIFYQAMFDGSKEL